jgi:peptide/nickel transport system substrate-binding protein
MRAVRRITIVPRFAYIPLFALLLACSGKAERVELPPTLTTDTLGDPKTFNMIVSKETSSSAVAGILFEGLIRRDPVTTDFEPVLAESWSVSPDGRTWTFNLRKDVLWSDGVPFTADDVVFTARAIYDPKVASSIRDAWMIEGGKMIVKAVDRHTVAFTLPFPFAPFLDIVQVDILPRHKLEAALDAGKFDSAWNINTPPEELAGTGPYLITKYVPAQHVLYEVNPRYWRTDEKGERLPYVKRRVLLIVKDINTAYVKFDAGDTDIYGPSADMVETIRGKARARDWTLKELGLSTGTPFIAFNRNPRHYVKGGKRDPRLDWFTDKRFLRALAHAVDKETIVFNAFRGYGEPAVADISPEVKRFHNAAIKDYEYDLKKAERLLDEAGYRDRDGDKIREDPNGNPVSFDLYTNQGNRTRERIAAIVLEDWKKLGLKVNYKPLEFNTLVEKLDSNFEWDAILIGLTGGLEPHWGSTFYKSSGHLHMWNPRQAKPETAWEAEIDRLIDLGARELDPKKRPQYYKRIQEILHEELPVILTARESVFVAHKNRVLGYNPTIWGTPDPEKMRLAY